MATMPTVAGSELIQRSPNPAGHAFVLRRALHFPRAAPSSIGYCRHWREFRLSPLKLALRILLDQSGTEIALQG